MFLLLGFKDHTFIKTGIMFTISTFFFAILIVILFIRLNRKNKRLDQLERKSIDSKFEAKKEHPYQALNPSYYKHWVNHSTSHSK